MKCRFCNRKAIYNRLCEKHFKQYFLKRVKKYLNSVRIKNKRILIAISGGKDSASLAHALNELKEEYELYIELYYINLGIKDHSRQSLKVVKKLAEYLNLKLNIENSPIPIDEINKRWTNKVKCAVCGTIKRYLMNKFAYENKFEYIATGHNLDDELFFNLHNLMHNNIDYFLRDKKILPGKKQYKLIGKIKPLYYLTEKETMIYALINNLPIYTKECPYSKNSTQIKFKEKIFFTREEKLNLIKNLNKLKQSYEEKSIKNGQKKYVLCKICGYPTTSEICSFCRLTQSYKEYKEKIKTTKD